MNYWLMKTEPDTYSIDDLKQAGTDYWEGIRNYQARNNLANMKTGDLALFYHSSTKPAGVAGIARVVKEAYPDETAWDPKSDYYDSKYKREKPFWLRVDVEFVEKFPWLVTLEEIKSDNRFKDMVLVKAPRLSVQPVTQAEFEAIKQLSRG